MNHRQWPILVALGFVGACGGESANVTGAPVDGGSKTPPSADGSTSPTASPSGPLSSACPAQIPVANSGCTSESVTCEYGTNIDPTCNTIALCGLGAWSITGPGQCPNPAGNPSSCPASFADVPNETACTEPGVVCDYPEAQCPCTTFTGLGQPPASQATWQCPVSSCPNPRPRMGSACTVGESSCLYTNDVGEGCIDGTWQELETGGGDDGN
jgi:hypothetical protein